MSANLENSAVAKGLEKVSFHSNPKEGQWQRIIKLLYNCAHSHVSKVMLKILQAKLQQFVNWEHRKGRGTRVQIANIHWIIEEAREFQKSIYFGLIDYTKTFDCVDHNKLKSLKRWEYQTTLPASWETCMQVKKQQLELDMEQLTGSKLGKEYIKAVYWHPAYLTFILIISCEMLGCMKHKLESRLQGEIISDMQMTPLLWQKLKRN